MSFWPKKTDTAKQAPVSSVAPAPAITPLPINTVQSTGAVSEPLPAGLGAAPATAGSEAASLSPEQRNNGAVASKLMMAGFGEIVSVLMRSVDHRTKPMSTLEELAVPAILSGQFSLAQAQNSTNGLTAPIGVVFWARVSTEIDKRLADNIAEPIKLKAAEWRSGPIVWIVDAVGEQKVIEAMLTRLIDGEWKGQEVRMRARTKEGTFKVGTLARPNEGQRAS